MNWLFGRIGRMVGPARIRHVVLVASTAFLLLGGAVTGLFMTPGFDDWDAGLQDTVTRVQVAGDTDLDGLPDALENQVGSDPDQRVTLGGGVPDGWIYHWFGAGIDWNDTSLLERPAMVPPQGILEGPWAEEVELPSVSVQSLYEFEAMTHDPNNNRGAWWLADDALDPLEWDNDSDGLPDVWLVAFGIDPLSVDASDSAPGDSAMTLREKFGLALDPHVRDTDGDGLYDREETTGRLETKQVSVRFDPTDPRAFSSRNDGVGDGYLVWFGLDPAALDISGTSPAGDGLTVRKAFSLSRAHCDARSDGGCDWRAALQAGRVVDPIAWDTLDDGVADAWEAADKNGTAHPLVDSRNIVIADTEAWDDSPWDGDPSQLAGVVVDAVNPEPSVVEVTLADAYHHSRPTGWNEAEDGPWWGGIPPDFRGQEGNLPLAVALRGWQVQIDVGLGRNESQPASENDIVPVLAGADPRKYDTDGDGIPDIHEYFGVDPDGEQIPRTDPANADTDGDGLSDLTETEKGGYGTHPLRRDSSGSFLTDGEEVEYWQGRLQTALDDHANMTQQEFSDVYGWLLSPEDTGLRLEHLQRLGPKGVLLEGNPSNVASRDADGDGIPDGAELFPNLYLSIPSAFDRNATDPARVDSDGDGLPDAWEFRWATDSYYGCKSPCNAPTAVAAWPIDPSKWNSLDPDAETQSDWDNNLAADTVKPAWDRPSIPFRNGLAYEYGLHPYEKDSTQPPDGIPDMFALHWGVQKANIPSWAEEQVADQPGSFAWVFESAQAVADQLSKSGNPEKAPSMVFIDLYQPGTIGKESNLLGTFSQGAPREKGTWILLPGMSYQAGDPGCDAEVLPTTGARREADLPEDLAARAETESECWHWLDYPIGSDITNRTNPWKHDFDDDGIPDAWEYHYMPQGGVEADLPAKGSLDHGCEDATVEGLPDLEEIGRSSYCLSWKESYQRGLDPLSGDSDGGGIPDWQEVVISAVDASGEESLDPLDPDDDRGDEDWDGDGILNKYEAILGTSPLSPDSDRDGLLDGNTLDKGLIDVEPDFIASDRGNGDLCLRRGGDLVEDIMDHRPNQTGLGKGPLTHTRLFEHYVSQGVLFVPGGDECEGLDPYTENDGTPRPYYRFKREGIIDPWTKSDSAQVSLLGAGQGTDSLDWDSSDDGLPDGWLVYWRDRVVNSDSAYVALDPNAEGGVASMNPDGDLVNLAEYRYARPGDWSESTDGPWWGGLDPRNQLTKDTDGDAEWFKASVSGQDALDQDNDADGVPDDIDVHPAIDPLDSGIIKATGNGYRTNYSALWPALVERATFHSLDTDSDSIPDFLDRARVRIVDVEAHGEESAIDAIEKLGPSFNVTGQVLLDEPSLGASYLDAGVPPDAAGHGAGVQGATVKAIVSDGELDATVGFGVTGENGSFRIQSRMAPEIHGGPYAQNVSVEGAFITAGGTASIQSRALELRPGSVELRIVVEPNSPHLQRLQFGSETDLSHNATAYKDMDPASFRIPSGDPAEQGQELRAIALDGAEPDSSKRHVKHAATGVFANTSVSRPLILTSDVVLNVKAPQEPPELGKPFNFTGTVLDPDAVPLPGRNVTIHIHSGSTNYAVETEKTDGGGEFHIGFQPPEAYGITAGSYRAEVQVELLDTDTFLNAPEPEGIPLTFVQMATWDQSALIAGQEVKESGVLHGLDATRAFNISLQLMDGSGSTPLHGRDVTIHLETLAGGEILDEATASSVEGVVQAELGPLDVDAPLQPLRLKAEVVPLTSPHDAGITAEFILEPVYPTVLKVSGDRVPIGESATIQGQLVRKIGTQEFPVHDDEVQILARPGQGLPLAAEGTGPDGSFTLAVDAEHPSQTTWTVSFPGSTEKFLGRAENVQVTTTHYASTALESISSPVLTGEPVPVAVSIHYGDKETPVPGAEIRAAWSETPHDILNASTDQNGSAVIQLQPWRKAGSYEAVFWFTGNATHDPSSTTTEHTIKARTEFTIEADPIHVRLDGDRIGSMAATLLDETGVPLVGRSVQVNLTDPFGQVAEKLRVTNNAGSIEVESSELDPPLPGNWTLGFTYEGSQLENTTKNATLVRVTKEAKVDIRQIPSKVQAGQSIPVRGTVHDAGGPVRGAKIHVHLDDDSIAQSVTGEDGAWAVAFTVTGEDAGNRSVSVQANAGPHYTIHPAEASLFVATPVQISVKAMDPVDDRVSYEVIAIDAGTGKPVNVDSIILAQTDDAGNVTGTYKLKTGDDGRSVLVVDQREPGVLKAVAVDDPSFVLAAEDPADIQAEFIRLDDGLHWGWAVIAAVAMLGIGMFLAYLRWRSANRSTIQESFGQATLSLQDPKASPEEVIRRMYQNLLGHLQSAGFQLQDHHTPRDVAMEAVKAFGLPWPPLKAATRLFERVAYSDKRIGEEGRDQAIQVFSDLVDGGRPDHHHTGGLSA